MPFRYERVSYALMSVYVSCKKQKKLRIADDDIGGLELWSPGANHIYNVCTYTQPQKKKVLLGINKQSQLGVQNYLLRSLGNTHYMPWQRKRYKNTIGLNCRISHSIVILNGFQVVVVDNVCFANFLFHFKVIPL